jgi:hypothetical protein
LSLKYCKRPSIVIQQCQPNYAGCDFNGGAIII